MNKEVVKAMNRKPSKKRKLSQWWSKNGYVVRRIILFPIWIYVIMAEKIRTYLNSKNEWSDERAQEILSYYIPRVAKWNAENKSFYFADNGMGWGMKCYQKKIKIKDREWWRKYSCGWGGKVRTYLIDKFELEGFEKIVGNTYDSWTEISFKLIQE